ncbi:hypothetical protein ABEU86_17195 [Pseudomonas paraversuta]|uniref:hypothetical protein n=1 Tax=Pseudomonas paraversuta TaxID=2750624 RepID=UPI003D2B7759
MSRYVRLIAAPSPEAGVCGQSGGLLIAGGDSHAGHGTAAIILLEFFTGLDFSKPADSLDQWQVKNFEK